MPTVSKIMVHAPARLHFGLLDCGDASLRLFGGLGAAINGLHTEVFADKSRDWKLSFSKSLALSNRLVDDSQEFIYKLEASSLSPCTILVESIPPEHMGLGSKTSLLLSMSLAVNRLHGKPLDRNDVTRLTGRGGTSGIGVNTFWTGGVITDTGHGTARGERNFQPSSARKNFEIPRALVRIEPSPDTRVRLFYDATANSIEGTEEEKTFRSLMPIVKTENLRAIASVYQGVLPAFQNDDMPLLAHAMHELNTCGMKAAEVRLQTNKTKGWLEQCWQHSIPAGLSSFGPTVFSIGHVGSSILATSTQLAEHFGLHTLGEFSFDLQGAATS